MSLPVVEAPQPAEPSYRSLLRGSCPLLPLCVLPLCVLLLLGGSSVALGFVALSSGYPAFPQCSLWAGFLVILLAIAGLTARSRPSQCWANVFFLLSVVCVPLNMAGFILCLDRGRHLAPMNACYLTEKEDGCYCCRASRCTETVQLAPARSCITSKDNHLQNLWFWLCAQHALASAVCFVAAVLRLRQIIISRPPSMDRPRTTAEDPDESEAAAPPSYSRATSSVPHLVHRAGDLCPLDPPPSYESVADPSTSASTQEESTVSTTPSGASAPGSSCCEAATTCRSPPGRSDHSTAALHRFRTFQSWCCSRRREPCFTHRCLAVTTQTSPRMVPMSPGNALQAEPQLQPPLPPHRAGIRCSSCDAVLVDLTVEDCSIQTSQSTLGACTQGQVLPRRGRNNSRTPHRPRSQPQPSSMVNHHSYRHIQQLVRKILEQPAALAPEVQELVDSIQNVLHMEEAECCATYIGQVVTEPEMRLIPATPPQQQPGDSSHVSPGS